MHGFHTLAVTLGLVLALGGARAWPVRDELAVTVALLVPPPLLDAAELQAALEASVRTVTAGPVEWQVRWRTEPLDPRHLESYETFLRRVFSQDREGLDEGDGGNEPDFGHGDEDEEEGEERADRRRRARQAQQEETRVVPITAADGVLRLLADEHFPGQTVLFVLAPRKHVLFGAHDTRHPYHYSPSAKPTHKARVGPNANRCVSAWVGSGRFFALDLAAGPCAWGASEGHLGLVTSAKLPFVGDGTQGPRDLVEALGLRAWSGEADEEDEEDADGEFDLDLDEQDDTEFDTDGSDGPRRVLTSQIAAAAATAVDTVLVPPRGSSPSPWVPPPAKVIVPVVVLTPDASPDPLPVEALDLLALEEVAQAAVAALDPSREAEVRVVSSTHSILEHPQVAIALARATLSKTSYHPQGRRFEVRETPYLDAPTLLDALRGSGDGLLDTLLVESGNAPAAALLELEQLEDAPTGAAAEDGVGTGADRVLPVFVLSDLTGVFAGQAEGRLAAFAGGRLVAALSSAVLVVHSSKQTSAPFDAWFDAGMGPLRANPSDATAHAAAGVVEALTGAALPGFASQDLTWANGFHPWAPFAILPDTKPRTNRPHHRRPRKPDPSSPEGGASVTLSLALRDGLVRASRVAGVQVLLDAASAADRAVQEADLELAALGLARSAAPVDVEQPLAEAHRVRDALQTSLQTWAESGEWSVLPRTTAAALESQRACVAAVAEGLGTLRCCDVTVELRRDQSSAHRGMLVVVVVGVGSAALLALLSYGLALLSKRRAWQARVALAGQRGGPP